MPAPQEENCQEAPEHHYVNVFAKEKKAEAHAAVFGMVSRNQFIFGLRQIEWNSLALRHRAYEENEESQRLKNDKRISLLRLDNIDYAERVRHHDYRDERKPQGEFVADHLGRTPYASEKSVLRIRCPAAQGHSVDTKG